MRTNENEHDEKTTASQADIGGREEDQMQRTRACHLGRGRVCAPWQPRVTRVEVSCLVGRYEAISLSPIGSIGLALMETLGHNASRRVSQTRGSPHAANSPPESRQHRT